MILTLLSAASPIPFHALSAIVALGVGVSQMLMKKGTFLHVLLGRIWVALMTFVAVSSFFIYELKIWGNYSPIHFLSVWTLLSIGAGIYYARIGNIRRHRYVMMLLFYLALVLTGAFTLLPNRLMYSVVFQ